MARPKATKSFTSMLSPHGPVSLPSNLRSSYRHADRWLRDHVVVWWLILVLVPGGTYAAAEMWLSDAHLLGAVTLGATFGVTFATVTVLIQRWRAS